MVDKMSPMKFIPKPINMAMDPFCFVFIFWLAFYNSWYSVMSQEMIYWRVAPPSDHMLYVVATSVSRWHHKMLSTTTWVRLWHWILCTL